MKYIYYPLYLALVAAVIVFNLAGRRRLSARARTLGNVLWGVAACTFMILASEPLHWFYEFRIGYWHAARLALVNPTEMYGAGTFAFVNLPILALPFLPFAALGEYQAGAVFAVLAAGVAVLAWRQLVRLGGLDGNRKWLLAGLFVLNGPLFYCLRQGNATILVLPLLAAALAALEAGRGFRAGMLLAAGGLIKPPLLLLPAYYALRRRWRVAAGSAAAGLTVVVASLALFGMDVHRAWYERCLRPFAGCGLASYTSQSVSSFLARWFCDGGRAEVWEPIPMNGSFHLLNRMLVGALAALTLLLCLARTGRQRAAAERLDFCLMLCLALVISPVCWAHYFLLLLLPAALLLGGRVGALSPPRLAATALAFLAMSLPVRGWSVDHGGLSIWVSHYLAGALLLLAVLGIARGRLAAGAGGGVGPTPKVETARDRAA